MTILLFEPEIPQNTGNIVRTLAATNKDLVIVEPMGFSLSERRVKRSALDYFDKVKIQKIQDLDLYLQNTTRPFYFFSKSAKKTYNTIPFSKEDIYIFGSETSGLPPRFLEKWPDRFYTIPQSSNVRSLNLANSVAIVLYRSLEEFDFSDVDKDLTADDPSTHKSDGPDGQSD